MLWPPAVTRANTLIVLQRSQELMPEEWVAIPVKGVPLLDRNVYQGLVHSQLHRTPRAPPRFRFIRMPLRGLAEINFQSIGKPAFLLYPNRSV